MRVLVCGSRSWSDRQAIADAFRELPEGSTVVHGAARGADTIAADLAHKLGFAVDPFPANWRKYGRAAGAIRNREMLDTNPDLVIGFVTHGSRGTWDTINEAQRRGIPTRVTCADGERQAELWGAA